MIPGWQRVFLFFLLGLGVVGFAAADVNVQLGVEGFRWREFDGGAQLLEETGPRIRATVEWRQQIAPDQMSFLELRGSLYGGTIDYDGQACTLSGSCVPFQTGANYVGLQGDGLVSSRYGANNDFEVFVGGGLDSWRRDIKGSGNVAGAIEDWSVLYVRGGLGKYFDDYDARWRGRIGFKYPL